MNCHAIATTFVSDKTQERFAPQCWLILFSRGRENEKQVCSTMKTPLGLSWKWH